MSVDQDVELTGNEADAADTYKSSFYLCVVASIPNSPTIHLVNNPAQPGIGKKDKLTIPMDVWKASETILPNEQSTRMPTTATNSANHGTPSVDNE